MKLSQIRGWDLEETLERVTVEEARMWEEFWLQELDVPDRTAYYLMGVMAETIRPHVKHPNSIKLDQMRIRFKPKDQKGRGAMTDQQRIDMAKQTWFGALGGFPNEFGQGPKGKQTPIMHRKIRPNQ